MDRLTADSIKNLLEMDKWEYHKYPDDISSALSELKEAREKITTLKSERKQISDLLHSTPMGNESVEEIRNSILDILKGH